MSYCDKPLSPGYVTEISFNKPEVRDVPAVTDGCRMRVVATNGQWRLLKGPLGGFYADCGDRHGWYSLRALNEAEAIDWFAEFTRMAVAE